MLMLDLLIPQLKLHLTRVKTLYAGNLSSKFSFGGEFTIIPMSLLKYPSFKVKTLLSRVKTLYIAYIFGNLRL